MMPFWTMRRVAQALGQEPAADAPITGISTDTRTVQRGELFVALHGEMYEAHTFLRDAVSRGASAVVVQDARRAAGIGVPAFVVSNTLTALGALAHYRRQAWGRPVIAVGGSNGKTSTKEMIRATLGARLLVHATTGNLNNQVGVPLTLLALPDDADIAVIEVGTNRPGEIALLRDIVAPDLAVVTTVQEEHLEGFGDLAGVLREEASLLDGVPIAVIPWGEVALEKEAAARARRVVRAGLSAGGRGNGESRDLTAMSHGANDDGTGWIVIDDLRVAVPLPGAHNRRNAMLAIAVARECGIALGDACAALGKLDVRALPPMRSAVGPLGDALLINDAYNSNPGSAIAALDLLKSVSGGRQRVAVLGTMRELGVHAERAHREVARAALDAGTQLVAGVGDFAAALQSIAPNDARVVTAPDIDALWPRLRPRLDPTAAILLKASRGVRLERLLPRLNEWAESAASPYLEG